MIIVGLYRFYVSSNDNIGSMCACMKAVMIIVGEYRTICSSNDNAWSIYDYM